MTPTRIAEYQENTSRQTYRWKPWLWLLDALVIGGLIAFFITGCFIHEMTAANPTQLEVSSTLSALLDRLYPYHLGYLFAAQFLLATTVIVEFLERMKNWKRRHSVQPLSNG